MVESTIPADFVDNECSTVRSSFQYKIELGIIKVKLKSL